MDKQVIILSSEQNRKDGLKISIGYFLKDNFKKYLPITILTGADFSSLVPKIGESGEVFVIIDKSLIPQNPLYSTKSQDKTTRIMAEFRYTNYQRMRGFYAENGIPCIEEDFNASGIWEDNDLIRKMREVSPLIKVRLEFLALSSFDCF